MASNGLHIPLIQWETVWWPITNVTVTLLVFLVIVIIFAILANKALKNPNQPSKLRTFTLHFVQFFDTYLRDSFWGDKKFSRKFYPLIVGIFCIIFFGNLFGLLIDWAGLSISETILYYLRPMHSDVNTTLVLASLVIIYVLYIQVSSHWSYGTFKGYLFNFRGANFWEKCVNVFVWWLHLIWLQATLASLSLRLFGNIFAWVILLWVITFFGAFASAQLFEVGRLLAIPFWFFEIFIALIQAIVFTGLMIAYFKNAKEEH